MSKIKNYIIIALSVIFVFGFLLGSVFIPDLEISKKDPKFAHQVVAYFLLDEYAGNPDENE